ncbi:hypothetical protein C1C91_22215 (plasmid) [Aeromonas caviae]|uniref:AbiTii domain-containing protein n=1 Tax=Aeromonas caviae TaxID=648 RepID=A0A7D5UKJ1_AERCA|nr:hypothetical protein C1C91_22215 [Aeromonas caviae]
MKRIMGAVRNQVLNWALELEMEGILGAGMSFNAERAAAGAAGDPHSY